MYAQLIAVCLVGSALAQPFPGFGFPAVWQQQQQQQQQQGSQAGAAAQAAQAARGGRAGQGQAAQSAAQASEEAARATRLEASGANREEAAAGLRRRQSVLLAADHEEGAGFEGMASSQGSAGAGDSAAVAGYCNGIPMTGSQFLCCDGQYYGNTWSEAACCGNSIYDGRFYGCKNNVLAPLYRPVAQPNTIGAGSGRLCGNYVWQMYSAPYELCCDGIHYPNPDGHFGCCGARAFDSRYYNCGRDEVKQRWYVYKRSTFVLAATEEVEAVGARSQSGVGRLATEEGGYAARQGSQAARDAAAAAAADAAAQDYSQEAEAGSQGSAGAKQFGGFGSYGPAGPAVQQAFVPGFRAFGK